MHIRAMVRAFQDLGHEVRIMGFAEAPTAESRRGFVDVIRSKMPKAAFEAAATVFDAVERRKVAGEIRQFRPDLLYKRHGKFDTGALRAAQDVGIPSVLEVNCLFTSPRYAAFEPLALASTAKRLERRALELATQVAAVSTPLGEDIQAAAPAANVIVVPNGVDAEHFHPALADGARVRTRFGLRGTVLGWTGIIREWHGVERLLRVIAEDPQLTLLIIGDGPGRATLEREAAALGVADRLIVTGRVPHAEIRDYVAAVDIAVVADERTGVASPMKLLEYMSMGRAVVAPRQPNIADLVEPDVDGVLFDGNERGDLSARITALARSPERRQALGAAARTKIERHRTWRAVASTILSAVSEGRAL